MPNMLYVCANDFIKRANEEKLYLPRTKLLKLMYFMFGHYLAKTGEVLYDERFQAWQYGPVLPTIYQKTRSYYVLNTYILDCDANSYITNANSPYGKKYFEIFDYVWDKYSRFSASSLTELSHVKGSPWAVTYNVNSAEATISNDLIKKYFRGEKLN